MGADYIPERDLKAACWMKHFARLLVEQPELYRTTPEDAAEIDARVLAFRVAAVRARAPITRTSVQIQQKNVTRKAAERLVRPTAQRIRTDPRIAPELKVAIGLAPPAKRRHRIPLPDSVPVLSLSQRGVGLQVIRVRDSASARKAKPEGTDGIELWEQVIPLETLLAEQSPTVADQPKASADDAPSGFRFIGIYKRTPIVMQPNCNKTGDLVSYVARWISTRGEPGAFGHPVSVRAVRNAVGNLGTLTRQDRRAA